MDCARQTLSHLCLVLSNFQNFNLTSTTRLVSFLCSTVTIQCPVLLMASVFTSKFSMIVSRSSVILFLPTTSSCNAYMIMKKKKKKRGRKKMKKEQNLLLLPLNIERLLFLQNRANKFSEIKVFHFSDECRLAC